MADKNELQIILSLVDEASGKLKDIANEGESTGEKIKSSFDKASKVTEEFADQARALGKTISNTGQTMAFFGAGITAPFVLALKGASENSAALKMRLDNLKAIFDELQAKIATAVIPIVDRFSNIVASLNNFLNSLNPTMVNTVLQATLMAGVFLTLAGISATIAGKIIVLTGNLTKLLGVFMAFAAANAPLLMIAGTIALIIALMFKFKAAADAVMNTFNVLFLGLKIGFDGLVVIVNDTILGIIEKLDWVMQQIAKWPGFIGSAAAGISASLQPVMRELQLSVNDANLNIQNNTNSISEIFRTGTSDWSASFDRFKIKIDETKDKILGLGSTTASTTKTSSALWKQQEAAVQSALSTMSSALTQAAAENKKFAAAAKVVAIGLAIVNTAVGVTNALAVPPPWLGMALAAIIGAAGAIQIATIAATPLAKGGIVTKPTNALIGEAGPEAVIPLSKFGSNFGTTQNIHIEVNNPVVRSDEDIDKLTEEISLRLAREAERI